MLIAIKRGSKLLMSSCGSLSFRPFSCDVDEIALSALTLFSSLRAPFCLLGLEIGGQGKSYILSSSQMREGKGQSDFQAILRPLSAWVLFQYSPLFLLISTFSCRFPFARGGSIKNHSLSSFLLLDEDALIPRSPNRAEIKKITTAALINSLVTFFTALFFFCRLFLSFHRKFERIIVTRALLFSARKTRKLLLSLHLSFGTHFHSF